jgi:drug/metabolite transporter (DMT)-like permease
MYAWPYLALFGSGLCWGLGLPFGKLALGATDAAHMILLRFLVAAAAALPVTLLCARPSNCTRKPTA